MTHPVIGILMDWRPSLTTSLHPHYIIRQHYVDAIQRAGGLPVLLPYAGDLMTDYLQRLDGLLLIGGLDIPPHYYNATTIHPTTESNETRAAFELPLLTAAHARRLPTLAICGGMQAMVVAAGGTLVQDIPSEWPDKTITHKVSPATSGAHSVTISPNTILHRLAQSMELRVNSAHHQAALTVGSLSISARAPDGIIEAVEDTTHPCWLGVQWHPEIPQPDGTPINRLDPALFAHLVTCAGAR